MRYTSHDVSQMKDLVGMAVYNASAFEGDSSKRVGARDYVKNAVQVGMSLGSGSRYIMKDKAASYLSSKGSRYAIAFLYGMVQATDGIEKMGATTAQAEQIEILMNGTMSGRVGISEDEFDGMAERGAAYMKRFMRR